ncbi:MAG: hypothetical protein KKG47_02495 [Proteobacteria bacterium]|nr:hypothetical protein [Pseudomonadota bacterium]MBU1738039.1 hypothetical protein [Pseudomonadota bacterium]
MEVELQEVRAEIKALRTRVEELADIVNTLRGSVSPDQAAKPLIADHEIIGVVEPAKGFGEWITRGALLQRIAAISFIMVFALLLRAITDSGFIDPGAGSLLGIGYVSVLVGIGWYLYREGKVLAPVFASFGILLLFSIVVESKLRFETLSTFRALIFLYGALLIASFIGVRFKANRLLAIGVLGALISSLVIDFPKTVFAAVAPLFLLANLVAFRADRKEVSGGLKWYVTGFTFLFWFLWGFKLMAPLKRGEELAAYLHVGWYIPELLLFCAVYLIVPVRRYFDKEGPGVFHTLLPAFNMLLFYLAGRIVVIGLWDSSLAMGIFAMMLVLTMFAIGWRLSAKGEGYSIGVGASFVAGAVILALGLPELTGNVAYAVPFWSLTAYGLALLSGRGRSGAVRVISYAYQIFTLFAGFMAGIYVVGDGGMKAGSLVAALVMTAASVMQFRWCRNNPPPPETFFARADRGDYSAVSILLVALAGFFFMFSMTIDHLAASMLADPFNVTWCSRSILINLTAIILMVLGYHRRSLEYIWVAVALGIFAMLKVFLADLFKTSGIPLVFSVLSFGVLAAAGSVILGKWQKKGEAA